MSHLLQKVKTRIVKRNLNPEWREYLTVAIADPNLPVQLVRTSILTNIMLILLLLLPIYIPPSISFHFILLILSFSNIIYNRRNASRWYTIKTGSPWMTKWEMQISTSDPFWKLWLWGRRRRRSREAPLSRESNPTGKTVCPMKAELCGPMRDKLCRTCSLDYAT